jgi:6-phosphogluconolactonase
VAAPQFNPTAGSYSAAQTITITTSTSGATIRYTTDGSTPTDTVGTVYAAPAWVAVDPLGKFAYVTNLDSDNVSAYSIDAATGELTAVAGSPFGTGAWPRKSAVDPPGKFLYVACGDAASVSAYTINAATGALTTVAGSPFVSGNWPNFVAVVRIVR